MTDLTLHGIDTYATHGKTRRLNLDYMRPELTQMVRSVTRDASITSERIIDAVEDDARQQKFFDAMLNFANDHSQARHARISREMRTMRRAEQGYYSDPRIMIDEVSVTLLRRHDLSAAHLVHVMATIHDDIIVKRDGRTIATLMLERRAGALDQERTGTPVVCAGVAIEDGWWSGDTITYDVGRAVPDRKVGSPVWLLEGGAEMADPLRGMNVLEISSHGFYVGMPPLVPVFLQRDL